MANRETLINILSGGEWESPIGIRFRFNNEKEKFESLDDEGNWWNKDVNRIPNNLTKVEKRLKIKPFWKLIKQLDEKGYGFFPDNGGTFSNGYEDYSLIQLYRLSLSGCSDGTIIYDWMLEEREE